MPPDPANYDPDILEENMTQPTQTASRRWTTGHPKLSGYYDVRLSGGSEITANCDPYSDDQEYPSGEIIDAIVEAFRRIPGQKYRRV